MNKCYITMLYSNESSFYYEFNYVFIISWSCKMKDFNGFLKMFRLSVSVKYTESDKFENTIEDFLGGPPPVK